MTSSTRPKRSAAAGCAIAVLMAAAFVGCGKGDAAKNGPPPAPEVGVITLALESYAATIQLPGRVTAYETSEVRPQIGGIVRSRTFREGAPVRAGQTLYTIDPSQARATLDNA